MAELDAKERNKLPAKDFAGPARSYPIEDKAHAENALGRAKQMLKRGTISQAAYDKICAKADKVLDKGGMAKKPAPKAEEKAEGKEGAKDEADEGDHEYR